MGITHATCDYCDKVITGDEINVDHDDVISCNACSLRVELDQLKNERKEVLSHYKRTTLLRLRSLNEEIKALEENLK